MLFGPACQLLRCQGKQFAARVGASLVCAAGLKQLVASDRDDYFSIAKRFASDAKLLSAVRQQLRDKRSKLSPYLTLEVIAVVLSNLKVSKFSLPLYLSTSLLGLSTSVSLTVILSVVIFSTPSG